MKWNLEHSYAALSRVFYKEVRPTPVKAPKIVKYNEKLAVELGVELGVEVLSGNELPEDAFPIAQSYAGHQFGHFTMLGDGRAILLGEQVCSDDRRFDIQLKGAGITPFSRGGDGRAALGPMLREYIISEAMYGLGIPTTRSLAVVETGQKVFRESMLEGAILTRVASSHIRVGTFQYARAFCDVEDLKELADYTIHRHYPELVGNYVDFLKAVINRQASLISQWQLVGFIHGVMNTDNMTISGETIDYGPCAFMDQYRLDTVYSSIDRNGRYAYGNQPIIGGWNLARFAESLLPLFHEDEERAVEIAQEAISEYPNMYHRYYVSGMRKKIGLSRELEGDEELIDELLQIMEENHQDYTNTFISLTINKLDEPFFKTENFRNWHAKWEKRKECEEQSEELMRNHNPVFIPRNAYVEETLEAAVERNDYSIMDELLTVLENPFDYSALGHRFSKVPPEPESPYRTFCGT